MNCTRVHRTKLFFIACIFVCGSVAATRCPGGIMLGPIQGPLSLDSVWPPQGEYHPCWSPDGTRIAFSWGDGYTAWDPALGTPNPDGSYIVTMTADGQAIRGPSDPLVNQVGWDNHSPDWSPDGEWIVYAGSRVGPAYISRISLSDGAIVPITGTIGEHPRFPKWSPDGSQIAYLGGDWQGSPGPYHVCLTDPDGSVHQDLTPAIPIYGVGVSSLSWSPDGTRIVFAQENEASLYVVDVETGSVDVLPGFPSDLVPGALTWALDDSILFTVSDGIYEFQIDTEATTQLTYGPDLLGDWHPCAGLVFSSARGCSVRWDSNIFTATPIPAPGAVLLGTIGIGLGAVGVGPVNWLRRRRTL